MSRKHRRDSKDNKAVYRSLALITQFGINMLVPICMMSALGIWLDKRYGASFWTILLFFVGAIAGAQNIYHMAKQIYETDDGDERKPVHEGDRDEDDRDVKKKE